MIVVDTNVLAYLYLPGDLTQPARRSLQRDGLWAAPLLWRSEFRNVLALTVRQGRLALHHAIETMDAALDLMTGREFTVHSNDVLQLADRSGCSAYDCEYVTLALDLDAPLITADRQVLAAFPETARSLAEFGAC